MCLGNIETATEKDNCNVTRQRYGNVTKISFKRDRESYICRYWLVILLFSVTSSFVFVIEFVSQPLSPLLVIFLVPVSLLLVSLCSVPAVRPLRLRASHHYWYQLRQNPWWRTSTISSLTCSRPGATMRSATNDQVVWSDAKPAPEQRHPAPWWIVPLPLCRSCQKQRPKICSTLTKCMIPSTRIRTWSKRPSPHTVRLKGLSRRFVRPIIFLI